MIWLYWLVAAIVLVIAELFSLDLVLLMLSMGAFAGLGMSFVTESVVIQALVAMVVAVGMLYFVRPSLVRKLHGGPELKWGTEKLIGERAVTTSEISAGSPGRIKVDGEDWSAEPFDETVVIPPGTTVEVLKIDGATAFVHPVPQID